MKQIKRFRAKAIKYTDIRDEKYNFLVAREPHTSDEWVYGYPIKLNYDSGKSQWIIMTELDYIANGQCELVDAPDIDISTLELIDD